MGDCGKIYKKDSHYQYVFQCQSQGSATQKQIPSKLHTLSKFWLHYPQAILQAIEFFPLSTSTVRLCSSRIEYRKLMNSAFEMWCNPFRWQSIPTFDTNGKVVLTIVSERLNKKILFIDVHCKISLCNATIPYFPFRRSWYTPSNAYLRCPIV